MIEEIIITLLFVASLYYQKNWLYILFFTLQTFHAIRYYYMKTQTTFVMERIMQNNNNQITNICASSKPHEINDKGICITFVTGETKCFDWDDGYIPKQVDHYISQNVH